MKDNSFEYQFHHINDADYQNVWDFQQLIHDNLKASKSKRKKSDTPYKNITKKLNHVIFCEHNHVITLGKSGKADHLTSDASALKNVGVEFHKINRGGDITYHGPGQITGYLIFDLEDLKRDVHLFVRNLEECVIRLLADYNIEGHRLKEFTGVWVETKEQMEKICAIGVHLSRWVSMHGFAFNVHTDLEYFGHIIPCGIEDQDKGLTSLSRVLGRKVELSEVQPILLQKIEEVFGAKRLHI